jgi:hypothetical protein
VQCEYDRAALSDQKFFDLYYHEDSGAYADRPRAQALTNFHVVDLEHAKRVLAQHYPDCAPLRAVLRSIDAAIRLLGNRSGVADRRE